MTDQPEPQRQKTLPAGLRLIAVFNIVAIVALLLLGLWAGRYDLLIALRGEGHEIKLIPIEAPAVATPSAIPQQQSATLPERYRSTDPAAMPWRFQPDGSLEWSDPAQQQRRLP